MSREPKKRWTVGSIRGVINESLRNGQSVEIFPVEIFLLNARVLSAGSCEEPLVDLSEVLKSDTDLLGMLSDNMGKQSEESGRLITLTLTSSR